MKIGIGLPSAVPGASGTQLTEWARRAEARGFSTLGTIDRIRYGNYEPLTALSAAAAVTERIGLATTVLLGPLRPNSVALAKQALSLDALSGGRFTLGIGLGGRGDDYEISQIERNGRGARLDAMLERILQTWRGHEVGPRPDGAPGLVVGGYVDASFKRAARFAEGWIAGGAPPDQFRAMNEKLSATWREMGREGKPRTMALSYFALGDRAEEEARAYLTHYYAYMGEEGANQIAAGAAKDAETVRRHVSAFEEAGCGELILFPSSSDPAQVDLLADAVGRGAGD